MSWIDEAVVYQVYLRSFADGNGDGVGDFAGLTAHLDHVASLDVDALWLSPCFQSPQADHGYDVADYTQIDPLFGTVAELEAFVTAAHARGLRVMLDLVPNHCSVEHAWFREAVGAPAGSQARSRFHFSDGRGPNGALPPNNWGSVFGGAAWTRLPDGQWYLHSFDSSQPDFNWGCDEVLEMMDDVLRFWFDRGVDGFRVDVAHGLVKQDGLPDWNGAPGTSNEFMWNQPGVHDVYRRWRKIADEYGACFVGEVWVASTADLVAYASPDELGQAFDFHLLVQPWHAASIRGAVEHGLRPGTAWALANHDVHRPATRYGQQQVIQAPDPADMLASARRRGPVDLPLGRRRAVAASLLMLALPGAAYLYQGDELALPEVLDLPDHVRQDPIWVRSGGSELGRDGCRVPMPWTAEPATFGFTDAASAWLPQPGLFGALSVEVQERDPWSPLGVVRRAVHARTRTGLFAGDDLTWLEAGHDVVAFRRGDGVCVVNTSARELVLPDAWGTVRVSSAPINGRILPTDACAWLSVAECDGVSPSPTPATVGMTKEQ
ncbi:alpha-glucosidase [Cellulomonas sp. WB94]|uniref:glycoside hydrolase family 13 protein n=1 Tax=Cellulomonas sp. WB94 TaxID=2173174 RepID=UPI000D566FE6|nr:glycoside hydrolase family 13 protein [Cellulomonas sp. WB94]PVU82709.1 alpha-glucosidase [Cellulomonas sp. WB94]